jgi:hypothetical protein
MQKELTVFARFVQGRHPCFCGALPEILQLQPRAFSLRAGKSFHDLMTVTVHESSSGQNAYNQVKARETWKE